MSGSGGCRFKWNCSRVLAVVRYRIRMMASSYSTAIDHVTVPRCSGRIGMIAAPGGGGDSRMLDDDLAGLRDWGARGLVSLVQPVELELLGLLDVESRLQRIGMWWRHLPIPDMGAPGRDFERRWRRDGAFVREALRDGADIVLHCWAGLGRTGTVAARLLVEMGIEPEDAMEMVREARPGTIQSRMQELHVRRCVALSLDHEG